MFFICLFATVAFPATAVAKHFRDRAFARTLGPTLIWLPISALVLASFPAANQIAKHDAMSPQPPFDPYSGFAMTPLFRGLAQLLLGYVLFHRRRP